MSELDVTYSAWFARDPVGAVNSLAEIDHASSGSVARVVRSHEALLHRYVELVNSGDAGNWNPETEDVVIESRRALGEIILIGDDDDE